MMNVIGFVDFWNVSIKNTLDQYKKKKEIIKPWIFNKLKIK